METGVAPMKRPSPAALLFRAVWDSHLHEMRTALAQERGMNIARVAASGVEFSGSAVLSIWAVEGKHLEQMVRRVAADFEKRAPRKYLAPKHLPSIMEVAGDALRREAQGVIGQTPMYGPEDSARAVEFSGRTVVMLEGVLEAQLRSAVYTAEANKDPWWKRAFSALFELVKLARP